MNCEQPDRDVPKLVCGYSLPCPWHTVIIDPPKLKIPKTLNTSQRTRKYLVHLTQELSK